jgi:hypothetical protein
MVDHILAVRKVLKPEQRAAFEALVTTNMAGGGHLECGLAPPSEERP